MTKYRKLTTEELQPLEQEFIEFLVVNGIVADDWLKLKENEPEKADQIIASFSDVVFEKILRGCRFIERISTKEYAVVCCLGNHFNMIALRSSRSIDFTDETALSICLTQIPEHVDLFTADKNYIDTRENEIWKLLNEGFTITEKDNYMRLVDQLPAQDS